MTLAQAPGPDAAPPEYVRLSAALLGVAPDALEPAAGPDRRPLADAFHAQCRQAAPAALAALLAAYGRARDRDDPAAVAQRLLADGGRPRADAAGAGARLTMLMWLYGAWYGGTETARMPASAAFIDPAWRADRVVSAAAYRNAWIWRFARARPKGMAGAPGAWAAPPPDPARFPDGA